MLMVTSLVVWIKLKKVLDVIGDEELELLRELKLIRERKEKLKKIIEAGE